MTVDPAAPVARSRSQFDVSGAVETLRAAWRSAAGGPERRPRVGVVLGSGLGHLIDALDGAVEVRMDSLPGLPEQRVEGHRGRFIFGGLEGVPVLLQAGRYHGYEGHPAGVVAAPVRIMAALGVEVLVLTNAVGGIDAGLRPRDIVLLDDQINFSFRAPLAGPVVGAESRFPDMSAPFDPELQALACQAATRLGFELRRGVYAGVLGPSYETAAEVRMLGRLGGDVVGMSTVPEVITAHALGMRVLGLSLVTNRATGLADGRISHEEVLSLGEAAAERMLRLVREVLVGLVLEPIQSGDAK